MRYKITAVIPTMQYPKKHGYYGTTIYRVWLRMKQRCQNPNDKMYGYYGGRGIKVCKRWQAFENWLEDMGERPTPKHTLERIDVNGDYEPSNCKWATMKEQGNNRRNNRKYTFNGETRTIAQWAESVGIAHESMRKRIKKWPLERALTEGKSL